MADLSVYTFTGRLVRDAEVKSTPAGKVYLEADVANNIGYGQYESTNWLKVKLWGDRANNIVQIFKKGALVGGSGEAKVDPYVNKNGEPKATLSVTVRDLQLLASKKDDSVSAAPAQQEPAPEDIAF